MNVIHEARNVVNIYMLYIYTTIILYVVYTENLLYSIYIYTWILNFFSFEATKLLGCLSSVLFYTFFLYFHLHFYLFLFRIHLKSFMFSAVSCILINMNHVLSCYFSCVIIFVFCILLFFLFCFAFLIHIIHTACENSEICCLSVDLVDHFRILYDLQSYEKVQLLLAGYCNKCRNEIHFRHNKNEKKKMNEMNGGEK